MSLWPLKILVKLVLARVPHRHKILRKLGIFKHGQMDNVAHALKIFNLHSARAYPDGLPKNFTMLELGPGDSILSALIAAAHGAEASYLCDEGHYAARDPALYRRAAQTLREDYALSPPDLSGTENFEDILSACNARYITTGFKGLKSIPAQSVDFMWSHSVVEHIRKRDFTDTFRELHRILKPTGRCSHNVDLQDHLNKSLNNLRFPEKFWENDYVATAGFYTNRLRFTESLALMEQAGFRILDRHTGHWPQLPLQKEKLQAHYRAMSDEELSIRTYHVLLARA